MQQLATSSYDDASIPFAVDRTVLSLCPFCLKVISANIFQENDAIMIKKRCEIHGDFKDIYWSDAAMFRRFMYYWHDGEGIDEPTQSREGCPFDCGICENHKTGTILANIDITDRCNLSCPVCFADAGEGSSEPTIDQIETMMQSLRAQRPVPCPAIQFSGGEPTMRDDLPEIVALAKHMGFYQIQLATNGLRLAASLNLCRALVKSGLNTVYLQFDGVTPEPYQIMRGINLLPIKKRAIEKLKMAGGTSVVLVPTVAKGVNDDQVGDIVKFASQNNDTVKGVNFQPVSFSWRIDQEKRMKMRITIPHLLELLEDQTDNEITRDDFYPVPFVAPISNLIAAETGSPQPTVTAHPCCGAATYIFHLDGQMIPITRLVDVEGLMEKINEKVREFDGSWLSKIKMNGLVLKELPKFIDDSRTSGYLNLKDMLLSIFMNGNRKSLIELHKNSLFVGAMHFQDLYNMDLERLQKCGIHYALPDGRLIPFCSYNNTHRFGLSNT
ncbi:MAG: radical SAM protein [Methanotrichaceae archaeon]|nr:radical SAM protein [Methanotrichaceae archaeon]